MPARYPSSTLHLPGNPAADVAALADALVHHARLAQVHVLPDGEAMDVLRTIEVDTPANARALIDALDSDVEAALHLDAAPHWDDIPDRITAGHVTQAYALVKAMLDAGRGRAA